MRLWKPRDILVAFLRDIDSGKCQIAELVIVYKEEDEGTEEGRIGSFQAAKSCTSAIGMLSAAEFNLNRTRWED